MTKSQRFSVAMMVGKTWIFLSAIIPCQLEQAFVCGYRRELFWRDFVGFGRISEEIKVKATGGVFEGAKQGHAYHDVMNLPEEEQICILMGRVGIPRTFW